MDLKKFDAKIRKHGNPITMLKIIWKAPDRAICDLNGHVWLYFFAFFQGL